MVPHRGTNWAALRLTAQIGRDAVLSESYGRRWECALCCGACARGIQPAPPAPIFLDFYGRLWVYVAVQAPQNRVKA